MADRHPESEKIFGELFNQLKMAVIVCVRDDSFGVVFLNTAARLLLAPGITGNHLHGEAGSRELREVLCFHSRESFQVVTQALLENGTIGCQEVEILSFQGDVVPAKLYANAATFGEREYYVIYIAEQLLPTQLNDDSVLMTRVLSTAHHITDVDKAIATILGLAGEHASVSRAYIFEIVSPTVSRNTYEWCAEGVAPVIDDLQHLDREMFDYRSMMDAAGMVLADDIDSLPAGKRDFLASHGVKAIAILPLFHRDRPVGFIGFDDCAGNREWSRREIQLLENTASVVSSLISRRNAERDSKLSRDIVQRVADNLEDLVYISDLQTHELKFISKSLARAVRRPVEEILGTPCWRTLHHGQTGPCPFCPLPALQERVKSGDRSSYVWELHNSTTGKWYMVKNILIDWIDGRPAHLGTFVDITYRKQYEEQLKRFAATDAMTDIYNRKWGAGKLTALYLAAESIRDRQTLCFIDIDGLKAVNDRLGHSAGDEMIQNIIRNILACIRKDDFVTRWGGDEFILFLNCPVKDARKVLAKIVFALDHFNSTANKSYTLSISYGLVNFASPAASLDDLIDEADRIMYRSKVKKRHKKRSLSG